MGVMRAVVLRLTRGFTLSTLAFRVLFAYRFHFFLARFLAEDQASARLARLHRRMASRLRDAAFRMKGVLIKVGQFLSARRDILPEEYIEALEALQDQVPPVPFETIAARIQLELGRHPDELFASFCTTPIASASLGQVHEAMLADGRHVAVKVQYPGIQTIVEADLLVLRWLVRLLRWQIPTIRFDVLYGEFCRILRGEMDYIQEGQYAERFKKNFAGDDRIVVPGVQWDYTTARVLTLEYVGGIKITHFDEIEAKGILLPDVARLLVESYLTQIIRHGFFHGDPHPGNLFVREGPSLVFVDFGIMQDVPAQTAEGVRRTIRAMIERDVPAVVAGLMDMEFISRGVEQAKIEEVMRVLLRKYRDLRPREFQAITLQDIAEDFSLLFRVYPYLQIPNHFILFGRTSGILNGLCSRLDPELNLLELAKPMAKEFFMEQKEPQGLIERLAREGRDLATLLITLPRDLKDFLDAAKYQGVKTAMSSPDVTGVLLRLYLLLYRGLLAIFAVGLLLSAAYLKQAGLEGLALAAGGVGCLASLVLLWSLIRSARQ